MDQTALMKALDFVYDKAIEGIPGTEGIPGMGSVEDFAQSYMKGDKSLEEKVDSLIQFQVTKASASGFVNGLGGFVTMPITLPTNLVSVFYIQLQMAAAIAYMAGYNVRDDRVRTFCYVCLCGESASKVLRGAGITIGKKLTEQMIKRLSFETIKKVNKAVGFRLVTKFGQTGAINLGKAVPVIGGLVGAAFDGTTTYVVGEMGKRTFIEGYEARSNSTTESDDGFWERELALFERDVSHLGKSIQKQFSDVQDLFSGPADEDEGRRKTWWA
ncbi:MAG: EcsC family protein [Rubrobacter sp.]